MPEQNDEGKTPVPENAATPTKPASAGPTAELPDWFLSDKYKTIDDQAKGTHDAVQAMKEAQLRAKEAESEAERTKTELETSMNKPPDVDLNNASDDLIEKLEEKFGKPFAQIKAEADLQSLIVDQKLQPIKSVILSQQYENALDKMENKSDLFKKYRPKIEAKLAGKQLEEKSTPQSIKGAWNEVIAENIEEIRNEAIETGKKSSSASPETSPNVAGDGNIVDPAKTKTPLSDSERKYYEKVGANPDEIEKFHNENSVIQKSKDTGWDKMFE